MHVCKLIAVMLQFVSKKLLWIIQIADHQTDAILALGNVWGTHHDQAIDQIV